MGKLIFTAITSEGGLLPSDFLQTLLSPGSSVPGMEEVSYHLAKGERVTEAVNRSWNRLKGCWENYQRALAKKNEGEPTTTETRDRWLLPLFQELGFGTLAPVRSIEIEGKSYTVSHGWGPVPIHLVGSHVDIDRRTPGAVGASRISPHSLVQQLLNASDDHLWGIVSNGMNLRLLRDNAALTRLAYVEWDLQAIFDADLYPEFLLLWLVCHQSRFEGEKPESCLLEQWKKVAQEKGLRALENLRPGVEKAITSLGEGLVGHKSNRELRRKLSSGELSTQKFYWQVLRVVYRMLFLFVAEDRDLLHAPIPEHATPEEEKAYRVARERYLNYYSITRLRSLSLSRAGTPHPDLWQAFVLVCGILGSDNGSPELALPALGSFLWTEEDSTPDLKGCLVSNRKFLEAVYAVAFVQDGNVRRTVDYRNLGAEELGSVYESLLELHPLVNADAVTFELRTAAGHERKTTGSYYTPDSLVQCLLDSALEPVMADAIKGKKDKEAVEAILNLKVCDPAVGSGHFLIAAAHRMAKKVAALRTEEEEPAPVAIRVALRDVIGHCLYGVDINPMAAELCRVSLWMEALVPGKPLTFLDHHIQVGNSLLGATPELIAKGVPDDAFSAIEGDDKKACSALKKRNKEEKKTIAIEHANKAEIIHERLRKSSVSLNTISDESLMDIRNKENAYRNMKASDEYTIMKLLADTWCSAFVSKKVFKDPDSPSSARGITQRYLDEIASGEDLSEDVRREVHELAREYRFFHWHLAFPEVSARGGFDCVLGNPPWERVKLQEKQWFAKHGYEYIATAPNASIRKQLIKELKKQSPIIYDSFTTSLRYADGEAHLIRNNNLYPLCGCGDMNTYAIFAECSYRLLSSHGQFGLVLPTGLVTLDNTKAFFGELMQTKRLRKFIGFDNEEKKIFPDIDNNLTFAAVVVGPNNGEKPQFCFNIRQFKQLGEADRFFELDEEDLTLLNPNTRTCPIFRCSADASIVRYLYSQLSLLWREIPNEINTWNIRFMTMFHMASDSDSFLSREQLQAKGATNHDNLFILENETYRPLYEAKMIWHFEHRWASFFGSKVIEGRPSRKYVGWYGVNYNQPDDLAFGRYWVSEHTVQGRVGSDVRYFVAFRDITNRDLERTSVFTILPLVGVGHQAPIILMSSKPPTYQALFIAERNAFVSDFITRNKIDGSHLTYFILKQLPTLSLSVYDESYPWTNAHKLESWLLPRVVELVYTAWDLEQFAFDCGWSCPPFRWDDERRFLLRCELDAAFFHLYLSTTDDNQWKPTRDTDSALNDGTTEVLTDLKRHFPTPRDAVAYIMDNFPIVCRRDEEKYGEYRTKRMILEIYDKMAEAIKFGTTYQTRLDPPPADPSCCHPSKGE